MNKQKKKCFVFAIIILFIYFACTIHNSENNKEEDLILANTETKEVISIDFLTGKTIYEIVHTNIIGSIVDFYYPTVILNCYVFVFKNEEAVYFIAANTEFENFIFENKIELEKFTAIGYYGINYYNGGIKKMFKYSESTPFDYLNSINPEDYVNISSIEDRFGIIFDYIDKGGFYSPFFDYYCVIDDMILFVMGSPSDNKDTSYFMGGWSYSSR